MPSDTSGQVVVDYSATTDTPAGDTEAPAPAAAEQVEQPVSKTAAVGAEVVASRAGLFEDILSPVPSLEEAPISADCAQRLLAGVKDEPLQETQLPGAASSELDLSSG